MPYFATAPQLRCTTALPRLTSDAILRYCASTPMPYYAIALHLAYRQAPTYWVNELRSRDLLPINEIVITHSVAFYYVTLMWFSDVTLTLLPFDLHQL